MKRDDAGVPSLYHRRAGRAGGTSGHSVPNTFAQCRAAVATRPEALEEVACVRCTVSIRSGSFCNRCRDERRAAVARRRGRALYAVELETATADVRTCDCGRPMPLDALSCSRCVWLDVSVSNPRFGRGRRAVISALRDVRWASTTELAEVTGISRRNVIDVLSQLERDRRVVRELEERTGVGDGAYVYVYRLNG